MKELMVVLEAVRQAQQTLAEYIEPGECDADAALQEMFAILNNPDVLLAMQHIYPLIDSPAVQPDPDADARLHNALPGS